MQSVFVRKNKKGVSPVIGTILMVAITVVLAAVLYVMVSGIGTNPNTSKPSLTLGTGQWNSGNISISLSSVQNAGNVNPTDLSYVIDKSGSIYFQCNPCSSSYTQGSVVTSITYNDLASKPNIVSSDDSIRIQTTNSTALSGSTFKVFYAGDAIGSVNLP